MSSGIEGSRKAGSGSGSGNRGKEDRVCQEPIRNGSAQPREYAEPKRESKAPAKKPGPGFPNRNRSPRRVEPAECQPAAN